MAIPVKFILSCNLPSGVEEAKSALAFLTQQLPEKLRGAGLELQDVWHTVYGSWPQLRMMYYCPDVEMLRAFLVTKSWQLLKVQILQHVQGYQQKVIVYQARFQL
ncbi:MAG: hypothetical protein P1S60_04525 [Anaerolineae bacterium]|nr:hypothetical protein [Anaerolineae bacterium]